MSILNQIILPAKNYSGYTKYSYPNHLIWLPETEEIKYKIPCLWFDCPESKIVIVFAKGNGMDLGSYYHYKNIAKKIGANMLFWEYPNYGVLNDNKVLCDPKTVDLHMNRVMDFILNDLKCNLSNVVAIGHSIGSGSTCAIASKLNQENKELGGVILQSPYTSIKDFVTHIVPNYKFDWDKENSWISLDAVKNITCPILFIHGKKDTLIPVTHTEQLFDASISKNKSKSIFDYAGHNDFKQQDITNSIIDFITKNKIGKSGNNIKLKAKNYRFT